jgi:hypothetical protein
MHKKTFFSLLIISIVFLVAYWRWFFDFSIISHGDWGFYYTETQREFFSLPFLWTSAEFGAPDLGITMYPVYLVMGMLSFITNFAVSERIVWLWPTVILGSFGIYFLVRKVLHSHIGGIVGSFVFNYNSYFVLIKTGHLTITTAFSIGLFAIYFYILALEKKNIKLILLVSFLNVVISFYEFRIFYLICFILLFYAVYNKIFIEKINGFKNLFFYILFTGIPFVIPLGIDMFWILAMLQKGSGQKDIIFSNTLFGSAYLNVSRSLTLFHPYWTGGYSLPFVVQPIPIYFWLIPLAAFLGFFFNRKNILVLFFAVIGVIGLFLTKQEAPPFPGVYLWLFHHFPGFNAFREASKFYSVIALSYAVLIGGLCSYVWNSYRTKFFGKVIAIIIFLGISFLFLFNTKSLITGEIGTLFIPRSIPREYIALKEYLLSEKMFYRTLVVPYNHRYVFYNSLHPTVNFSSNLDTKMLNLLAVKYVILPYDSWDDYYKWISPQNVFEDYIWSYTTSHPGNQTTIRHFKDFGKIKVWTNKDFPEIFPVKDVVFVDGSVPLQDYIDLPTSEQVAYYSSNLVEQPVTVEQSLLNFSNKIYTTASCIRCDLNKKYTDYIEYPYANILPNSLFYAFIAKKEKKETDALTGNEQILKLSFYSLKRAVEIDAMITKNVEMQYIKMTLTEDEKLLDEITQKINAYGTSPDTNDFLLSLYDNLWRERQFLIESSAHATDYETKRLFDRVLAKEDTVITALSRKVIYTKGKDKRLTIHVPEDGSYTIFSKKDTDVDPDASSLVINGEQKAIQSDTNGYVNYGNIYLKKGTYFVQYIAKQNNLAASTNVDIPLGATGTGSAVIPIIGLNRDRATYKISYEYSITGSGENPRVFITDKSTQIDPYTGLEKYISDEDINNYHDTKWYYNENIFGNNLGITNAALHITIPQGRQAQEKSGMLSIRNISVEQIYTPTIILVKGKKQSVKTPKITYKKINQSHYKIHIEDASTLFFLTFSEDYNSGWKLFESEKCSGEKCDKWFTKNLVASYFGEDIHQSEYINDQEVLFFINTFFKKPLFTDNHTLVNNYANGWTIDKKGTYDLDLVYVPQRYVYVGGVISLALLAGVLLVIYTIRKKFRQ